MTLSSTLLLLLGALGPSLLIAWAAGFVVRKQAGRWGLVAVPGEHRAHDAPTPLGGGLAIWLGVVAAFAGGQIALWLVGQFGAELLPEFVLAHAGGLWAKSAELWMLLGCATLLMIVGLIDDRRGLDWRVRLVAQTAVAAVAVLGFGWRLTFFIELPVISAVASVLWIVTLVNAFNMLDNMDGLSAGVAAIAATILAGVLLATPDESSGEPQLFVAGLLLVLVGALLGFLWHNRPRARLFMGDAGSYFLGFLIAVGSILATYYTGQGGSPRHASLAPLCVLAVPLYDLTTVVWIRLRTGKSPFAADNNHFSHRLVQLGLTRPQAVATIYLTTATCGMGALLLHQVNGWGAAVILLSVGCVLSIIAILERTARHRLRDTTKRGS